MLKFIAFLKTLCVNYCVVCILWIRCSSNSSIRSCRKVPRFDFHCRSKIFFFKTIYKYRFIHERYFVALESSVRNWLFKIVELLCVQYQFFSRCDCCCRREVVVVQSKMCNVFEATEGGDRSGKRLGQPAALATDYRFRLLLTSDFWLPTIANL